MTPNPLTAKPGRKLDAIVGKAIGWKPEIIHIATKDGGKSCCASVNLCDGPWHCESDLRQWLAEQHAKGYQLDYAIAEWERWPHFTDDAGDDYRVLETIQKMGSEIICDVRDAIKEIWDCRAAKAKGEAVWGCTQYQPGDWSRAALMALGPREPTREYL